METICYQTDGSIPQVPYDEDKNPVTSKVITTVSYGGDEAFTSQTLDAALADKGGCTLVFFVDDGTGAFTQQSYTVVQGTEFYFSSGDTYRLYADEALTQEVPLYSVAAGTRMELYAVKQ